MPRSIDTPQDYADMMIAACAPLREKFGLDVGGTKLELWGPSIVLIGPHCNVWMFAESQRDRDFEIFLVPKDLKSPEVMRWSSVSPSGNPQKRLWQLVDESPEGSARDKRAYRVLSRFWSWKSFFFGGVPAMTYASQFSKLCDLLERFGGKYLAGEVPLD